MSIFLNSFLPDQSAPGNIRISNAARLKQKEYQYRLVNEDTVHALLRPRDDFSHKGTFGHALLIAGERETMGAALLTSKGCVYSGAGLTTACIPESGLIALNTTIPEVMYLSRDKIANASVLEKYDALAVGPGLGKSKEAGELLSQLVASGSPLIADADALNIFASDSALFHRLAKNSIITPHMKEFDNLFGAHQNWYERLQCAVRKSMEMEIVIVLKNRYTFVIDQQGRVNVNTSGHPAMAQGGMGDVLTGIIAGYVAQGYSMNEAAIIACYIHGAAGTQLSWERQNITASEVAMQLPVIAKRL